MGIFETNTIGHVIVVDHRQWPSLVYDSADKFPIIMLSVAIFKCAGPDAMKAKVIKLY